MKKVLVRAPLLSASGYGVHSRQIFQFCQAQKDWEITSQVLPWGITPWNVSHDMEGGIYFRTQNRGQQLIVGSVLEKDERETVADPDEFDRDADEDFRLVTLHVLHHRLPKLPQRGKVQGFSGLYTTNRDDVHPIVGPTDVRGFWVANGFSGHGFKLAPAIGSMVAKAITGDSLESDTSIPMSFFSIDREPIELETKSVLA